jgi:hypothetical protein
VDEPVDQVAEVRVRAGESVELRDGERVGLAVADPLQRLEQPGPVDVLAREALVGEDGDELPVLVAANARCSVARCASMPSPELACSSVETLT